MSLDKLVTQARKEPPPAVSVEDRVMASLQAPAAPVDDTPLRWMALGGSTLALALGALALVAWTTLLDPLAGDAVLTAWGLP